MRSRIAVLVATGQSVTLIFFKCTAALTRTTEKISKYTFTLSSEQYFMLMLDREDREGAALTTSCHSTIGHVHVSSVNSRSVMEE